MTASIEPGAEQSSRNGGLPQLGNTIDTIDTTTQVVVGRGTAKDFTAGQLLQVTAVWAAANAGNTINRQGQKLAVGVV